MANYVPTSTAPRRGPLELWAGIECTQNRVRDGYFEQLDRTGHSTRVGDLQLIASLGARAVRYPVLWERIAPESLADANWSWPDERLKILRSLELRPIVGLVHHGSGPRHTSLLDPEFPERLAQYATAVAERYPWVDAYTPINEPLTTARFSGLYGHWYPHGKSSQTFVRTLLNQCRGTVLAMRAVRAVNSGAILVQTDDLGHVSSTPHLRYQAEMENERRWLSFDLLCGTVDEHHPLWKFLRREGADLGELRWFSENPCPPDILGLNYYLTSERFLHEKLFLYPRALHGGNGRDRYVDLETARARTDGLVGAKSLLLTAWERFHIPLVITECHNGCTREEQMRWLVEVWDACEQAIAAGANVRALTAWSLFGAFDWDSLVTRGADHYEPGVFDVRSPQPRATALAGCLRQLAAGVRPNHPLLDVPGWWRRPERFVHGFSVLDSGTVIPAGRRKPVVYKPPALRPLLLVGDSDNPLQPFFVEACEHRGIPYRLLAPFDLSADTFAEVHPWAAIHLSGSGLDLALAGLCGENNVPLVSLSTDLVFDGTEERDYIETDSVAASPFADAEAAVLARCPSALILRTGPMLVPSASDPVTDSLRRLAEGERVVLHDDRIFSPTYVPDLVYHSLDLLMDQEMGVWHLANAGSISWHQLMTTAAHELGIPTARLVATLPQTRTVLGSVRGNVMPNVDDALLRYVQRIAAAMPLRLQSAAA